MDDRCFNLWAAEWTSLSPGIIQVTLPRQAVLSSLRLLASLFKACLFHVFRLHVCL